MYARFAGKISIYFCVHPKECEVYSDFEVLYAAELNQSTQYFSASNNVLSRQKGTPG